MFAKNNTTLKLFHTKPNLNVGFVTRQKEKIVCTQQVFIQTDGMCLDNFTFLNNPTVKYLGLLTLSFTKKGYQQIQEFQCLENKSRPIPKKHLYSNRFY